MGIVNRSLKSIFDRTMYAGDCIVWTGATDRGYGIVWINNKRIRAHRIVYEQTYRPLKLGEEVDHICRNRICVNPGHLEAVSGAINRHREGLAKKDRPRCKRGHLYDEFNTWYNKNGDRFCRRCLLLHTWKRRGKLTNDSNLQGEFGRRRMYQI